MYCSKCEKEISAESEFCPYCGTDLQIENNNNEETENMICKIAIAVCVLIIICLIYWGIRIYKGV